MASSLKLLFAVLLVCFLAKGNGQSPGCDLQIRQRNTQRTYESQTVYEVEMTCTCFCAMRNAILDVPGYRTSKLPVDPKIFRYEIGVGFIVNDAQPIQDKQTVAFSYSSDEIYDITLKTFQLAC